MEERFETFTTLVSKISRYIRKIKSEEMEDFNLKSSHVSCLYYLYKKNGGMTANELSDVCEEDKASISRTLDFLEHNGYINCQVKLEKRYRTPLTLTTKGQEIGEKIAKKIDEVVSVASVGLTEADREVLYKSLGMISNNLQKICDTYGDEWYEH